MNPVEWYFARGNKQMGPVSPADLKRMALAGELQPDDLVWREGLAEWAPASNVRGLFGGPGQSGIAATPTQPTSEDANAALLAAEPNGTFLPGDVTPELDRAAATFEGESAVGRVPRRHLLSVLIEAVRSHFGERFIEIMASVFRITGLYGLLLCMVLTVVILGTTAVKIHQIGEISLGMSLTSLFLPGAALLLGLVVLHWVAGVFCERIEALNRNTPGYAPSAFLFDAFAVLNPMIGVALFLRGLPTAAATASIQPVVLGTVSLFAGIYLGFVALNPAAIGMRVEPKKRLSEDAIGVLTFVLKMLLQAVPVAFGVGVVCGTLTLILACYQVATAEGIAIFEAGKNMTTAGSLLVHWAAAPLLAYLAFLACHVPIDLWRAILALPEKLDASSSHEAVAAEVANDQDSPAED